MGIKLVPQAPRCPGLQIATDFLRSGFMRRYDDVHVVRPAIDRKKMPITKVARFFNLSLYGRTLIDIQAARVFGHLRCGFKLEYRVG
jgi:hypothetical protein